MILKKMNSTSKVGEIFNAAGLAFTQLAELTMQLHSSSDNGSGGKWTTSDLNQLHHVLQQFANELSNITENIKLRNISQIKQGLKRKSYQVAGLEMPLSPNKGTLQVENSHPLKKKNCVSLSVKNQSGLNKSGDVTLNALNTNETDEQLDVEEHLEFDSTVEEPDVGAEEITA